MEKLVAYLEEKSYREAEAYIDEVMVEASEFKANLIKETEEKLVARLQRAKKQAQELEKQMKAHALYEEKTKTSRLKEKLIGDLLVECESYFSCLSDEEYCMLIERSINQHASHQAKPRLLVNKVHHEAVVERFGREYQVISADKIKSGFVLSFGSYDVNFEIDQIFRYYREELIKIALEGLFGDQADER